MVTAKEMCAQGLLLGFFPAYYKSHKCLLHGTSLVVQSIRIHLPMQGTRVRSLGWEDLLEKEMATHSSILAWRIPRMEELGGLQSMGRKQSDMTE